MTRSEVIDEELNVGTLSIFTAAGFTEAIRPTIGRAVVRIDV